VPARDAADLTDLRRTPPTTTRLVGVGMDQRDVRRRVRPSAVRGDGGYLDRWGPTGAPYAAYRLRTGESQKRPTRARQRPGRRGRARWELLSTVGPALVAAFANSPGRAGRWHGWASARMAVWLTLDPGRTAEPRAFPGETIPQA
jgi:glutamate--cysteine ligase